MRSELWKGHTLELRYRELGSRYGPIVDPPDYMIVLLLIRHSAAGGVQADSAPIGEILSKAHLGEVFACHTLQTT